MYEDDDLYVVIVGDMENEVKVKSEPVEIKPELFGDINLNAEVEEVLFNAAEHGEFLEFGNSTVNSQANPTALVKFENDDDNIDIKDEEDYLPTDEEFLVKSDSSDDDNDHSEFVVNREEEEMKQKVTKYYTNEILVEKRPRKKLSHRTPSEINSYVKHLRAQFPELQEDKELLINCLVEIMKSTRRPEPPPDCFVFNGDKFQCQYCHVLSPHAPAARYHYQEKHGERYLICWACGADFRSVTNLYKHEKRCNSPDIKVVLRARAISVGRRGRSRPFLPEHTDAPPRRFECTECSASFASKASLEAHGRLHRGERPFLCPHCPRAYTWQATLMRHIQNHGTQEYICDLCQRGFKLKASLILHMATHAPRKYPCGECDRRYSQKSALRIHVHRDHRRLPLPFPCKICPRRYPRMSKLKEHMKKMHGLVIMTRKMFFEQAPMLSDTQLQQAKVVLKSKPHEGVIFDEHGNVSAEL